MPTYLKVKTLHGHNQRMAGMKRPRHQEKNNSRGGKKMDKYICTICGYVYDPKDGDPETDIPPGTPFEELPTDWVCPICGAGKEDFKKVD